MLSSALGIERDIEFPEVVSILKEVEPKPVAAVGAFHPGEDGSQVNTFPLGGPVKSNEKPEVVAQAQERR